MMGPQPPQLPAGGVEAPQLRSSGGAGSLPELALTVRGLRAQPGWPVRAIQRDEATAARTSTMAITAERPWPPCADSGELMPANASTIRPRPNRSIAGWRIYWQFPPASLHRLRVSW